MNKIFTITISAALAFTLFAGCGKADAVLYKDNATALLADKTSWTATADSETPDGWENTGKATAVLDGNIATYWHTDYSVVTPYPHWVLIDMKKEYNLITVMVTNRQGSKPNKIGMKKFKLEGSTDGTNFELLGEFELAISNSAQSFPVSSDKAYRYIKLTALTSQTGTTNHTFLAEIDVVVTKS
ncbi:MAG: discoidin domain-containing protein [Niabella sp.]